MNALVAVLVTISFFRRYATKEDIKDLNDRLVSVEARLGNVEAGQAALEARQTALSTRFDRLETRFGRLEEKITGIEKKADAANELHHAVRVDLKVMKASIDRIEGFFETPKLKSS